MKSGLRYVYVHTFCFWFFLTSMIISLQQYYLHLLTAFQYFQYFEFYHIVHARPSSIAAYGRGGEMSHLTQVTTEITNSRIPTALPIAANSTNSKGKSSSGVFTAETRLYLVYQYKRKMPYELYEEGKRVKDKKTINPI